jgi:aspartate/methionine/tyrosine aminotransferase
MEESMSDKSHEWFLLIKGTPGEKYHLATPGRYPSTLDVVYDFLERDQSLDWSGQFYGDPTIVNHIIETQEYDLRPEDILPVAGGTSMANFLACQALLRPGDEAIVQSPAWTQVGNVCGRMGVKVNWWYLRPENQWRPDLSELSRLINDRTKLIYFCNPNNPTGSVLTPEETVEICCIADRHGTYVLSDEIYRGLEWEGDRLSPTIVDYYHRGICSNSLTKVLGVCGLRFGWIATRDKELYDRCFDVYYDCALCNNIMSEKIAAKLLEPDRYRGLLEEGKRAGRENLQLLSAMIARNEVLSMVPPQGAYCCFLRVDTGELSWDLCERVLKRKPIGVTMVPGITYNDLCEHHVRIGFGAPPANFRAAMEIVEQSIREKSSASS